MPRHMQIGSWSDRADRRAQDCSILRWQSMTVEQSSASAGDRVRIKLTLGQLVTARTPPAPPTEAVASFGHVR